MSEMISLKEFIYITIKAIIKLLMLFGVYSILPKLANIPSRPSIHFSIFILNGSPLKFNSSFYVHFTFYNNRISIIPSKKNTVNTDIT